MAVFFLDQKNEEIKDFLGMKIKNLTTFGERSATGMSSETGVLIIDVPAKTTFSGYLRPNDVVLGYNGNSAVRIYELMEQQVKASQNKMVKIKIFRDQKEQIITVKLIP